MSSSFQINRFCNLGLKPPGEEDELCNQLWLACAGPLVNVPQIGDKVYYFPQGHLEQVEAYMKNDGHTSDMPVYNVPPKILCKVVNVDLKAETNTDEVYAQITLLSESEEKLISPGVKPLHPPLKTKPKIYWKKLTTSDTSTHGGLSIPKRCADEIFYDIDMTKDVPSEDLVAKDLQGCKWHFRHIYRGQPKRHLITTGWSLFVTSKKLVAGDTAVFLRGENKFYIGIHRAKKKEYMSPVLSSLTMRHGILTTAFHAMNTGSLFTVYSRPWTDPAQFIVPYDQYVKSIEIDYPIGTRFRMQFESPECLEYKEYKFLGTIIGSEDIDSIRWPNSGWRQLKVHWDNTSDLRKCPGRVSPWSIEVVGVIKKKASSPSSSSSNAKRARLNDHCAPELPFQVKDGCLLMKKRCGEFGIERHDASLQGQEMRAVDLESTVGKVMLFGVNLVGPQVVSSSEPSRSTLTLSNDSMSTVSTTFATRSCTKVLKGGCGVLRGIDVTNFEEYKQVLQELDRMFEFNGSLVDGTCNWHVTYFTFRSELLLFGNCPWPEFKASVQQIFICPKGIAAQLQRD